MSIESSELTVQLVNEQIEPLSRIFDEAIRVGYKADAIIKLPTQPDQIGLYVDRSPHHRNVQNIEAKLHVADDALFCLQGLRVAEGVHRWSVVDSDAAKLYSAKDHLVPVAARWQALTKEAREEQFAIMAANYRLERRGKNPLRGIMGIIPSQRSGHTR